MPPSREPAVTGLKLLEDWAKSDLANLAAKIYSKSVCVKGLWFRSLDDCIFFSQIFPQKGSLSGSWTYYHTSSLSQMIELMWKIHIEVIYTN